MESSAYGFGNSEAGFGAQENTERKPVELLLKEMRSQQAEVCDQSAQHAYDTQVIAELPRAEILSGMTIIYDALVGALETGSNDSLARCVADLTERLVEREVGADEALGMAMTLRDDVSHALISTYQRDYQLLREVLDVLEAVTNRLIIALMAGFRPRQKEAEYELWQQVSEMFDESSDCVITVDPQGGVLFINKAGRDLLGLSETDNVTTMALSDTHPEWVSSLISEQAVPTAIREDIWRGESALVSRDGVETVVALAIGAHHTSEGRVDFLTITAHELKERGLPRRAPTLSAPMLTVREGILLAPVVGDFEAEALKRFAERLLLEIRDLHARAAIIELTGAPEIDETMAGWLPEISAAARLLGATLIISGVSASAAQSLAGLGINLSSLNTAPDLEVALEQAQRAGGYRFIEMEDEAA